ncbi:Inositol oxygenase, partial [Lamellibrachia satsuma]
LEYWTKFDHGERTIMEALDVLNSVVDESDPDVNIPNSVHAYQTAERIREVHPGLDWFHLVGLIHDLGKVMVQFGEPQWSVTGDTFPLGCRFSDHIVFGRESFTESPDYKDPVYSTKLGVYEENCGLQRVVMSWGHDEYLYRVLRNHATCRLPEEALYVIRYHSFYPYHTSGDYTYLCDNSDADKLEWLKGFNKFDLYSKADSMPDTEELRSYYQGLIDKYIPGKLKW